MRPIYGVYYDELGEIWVPLNYEGNILPNYEISNHGRARNTLTNKILAIETTPNGYNRIRLNLGYRHGVNYLLHRAVKLSFDPIPDFKSKQVNHIDGCKNNNYLHNLEWSSARDNIAHAIEHGLRNNKGINCANNVYTEEEIIRMCELIDQGLSNGEIATILCGDPNSSKRENYRSTVNNIRHGKTWRHISQNFKFMENNDNAHYDDLFVHMICQFLSDPNKDFTYTEIMDLLQIPNNERVNFKIFVEKLYNRKIARDVTCYYPNLKKPLLNRIGDVFI